MRPLEGPSDSRGFRLERIVEDSLISLLAGKIRYLETRGHSIDHSVVRRIDLRDIGASEGLGTREGIGKGSVSKELNDTEVHSTQTRKRSIDISVSGTVKEAEPHPEDEIVRASRPVEKLVLSSLVKVVTGKGTTSNDLSISTKEERRTKKCSYYLYFGSVVTVDSERKDITNPT